jgi:hypothetical protein
MRWAAARIHWSARGTSLTSSQAQKNPHRMESTVASSRSSPAQVAASASSNRTRPSSTRSVMSSRPPRSIRASNSTSGSPPRRPMVTASRSSASRACASGSDKALMMGTQPRSGRSVAGLLEDGPSPGPPSALHRPLAEDVPGDPGQGAGRPAGGHALTLPAVGGVGALVVGRRRGVLALQVQRLGKAFQHLARFDLSQSGLEGTASGGGVASAQRRRPFLDQGRAHPPMMARPDVTEAART